MSEPDASNAVASSTVDTSIKRQKRLGCLYAAGAFFVSYVITAGPAVFITRRFDQPMFEQIVRVLYAPLILVVESNVPIVSPIIKAWIQLFR